MEEIIFLVLIILIASVVHSTAGFGFSIITMMFFPLYFTVPESIVLKTLSSFIVISSIVIRYRKKINFRLLVWPLLLAVPGIIYGVIRVTSINNELALIILGVCLILLSAYFYFLSGKIKIPANKLTAMMAGGMSGLMAGFMGVSGPPIVLYYSVVFKDKEAYMATIQTFFITIDTVCLIFLMKELTFTPQIIQLMPLAVLVSVIGMLLGNVLFRKMTSDLIHKVVYITMFFAGNYYMIKGILS